MSRARWFDVAALALAVAVIVGLVFAFRPEATATITVDPSTAHVDRPKATAAATRPSALFIGDSYTAGGGSPEMSYGCMAAVRMGWLCNLSAVRGTGYIGGGPGNRFEVSRYLGTSKSYAERIPNLADVYQPDVVVLDGGRNDRNDQSPPTERCIQGDDSDDRKGPRSLAKRVDHLHQAKVPRRTEQRLGIQRRLHQAPPSRPRRAGNGGYRSHQSVQRRRHLRNAVNRPDTPECPGISGTGLGTFRHPSHRRHEHRNRRIRSGAVCTVAMDRVGGCPRTRRNDLLPACAAPDVPLGGDGLYPNSRRYQSSSRRR